MIGLLKICAFGVAAYGAFLVPCVMNQPQLSSFSVRYDVPRHGIYRIYGRVPKGFEAFYEFELAPPRANTGEAVKDEGRSEIDGALFVRPSEFGKRVETESRGELNIDGAFSEVNVVRLMFKSATLLQQPATSTEMAFETESIQEVHYLFKGIFIDGFLLPGGPYVSLRGTLIKFKQGRRVAESELSFVRSSYE